MANSHQKTFYVYSKYQVLTNTMSMKGMIRTEALPDPFFSLLLNTRTKKEKSENWRVKNRSGSASVLIRTFIDIVLVNI